MIMNDKWIADNLPFLIRNPTPEDYKKVNPGSLDVTLGSHITVKTATCIDDPEFGKTWHCNEQEIVVEQGTDFTFLPNRLYICHSNEYLRMPNDVSATFLMKSTLGRMGLTHAMAGYLDAGWEGQLVYELYAIVPVTIPVGRRVGQIVYYQMNEPARKVYAGKYQGQVKNQGAIQEESVY